MKILYINLGDNIPYSYDKPAGRIISWAKLNNSVYLLAPQLDEKSISEELLSKAKIKVILLPFTKETTSSTWGILFTYFIRILLSPYILFCNIPNFDFAISNSAFLVDIFPILWLKAFGRCRHWVIMIDNLIPNPRNRLGNVALNIIVYLEWRLVLILANKLATVIFTINPEVKKTLMSMSIPNAKILETKCGLFVDKIASINKPKNKLYDACYLGRISENKGVFDLINVWKKVSKTRPRAKLAVVGAGREEVVKEFQRKISEANLDKKIVYFGFVSWEKKYEILKASKLFVFLSRINAEEAWAISLMEALACGLPAISYNLPIYRHIYKTDSLITVPLGDVDAVVRQFLMLIDDQKLYRQLSQKSLDFAKNFEWFKIARADLAVIRKRLQV